MMSTLVPIWKAPTLEVYVYQSSATLAVALCKMLRKGTWMWEPLLGFSSQLDWLFFCALKVEIFEEKHVRKVNSPKLVFLSPFPLHLLSLSKSHDFPPAGSSLTDFVVHTRILKETNVTPGLYKQPLTNPSGQQAYVIVKYPIVTAVFFLALCIWWH